MLACSWKERRPSFAREAVPASSAGCGSITHIRRPLSLPLTLSRRCNLGGCSSLYPPFAPRSNRCAQTHSLPALRGQVGKFKRMNAATWAHARQGVSRQLHAAGISIVCCVIVALSGVWPRSAPTCCLHCSCNEQTLFTFPCRSTDGCGALYTVECICGQGALRPCRSSGVSMPVFECLRQPASSSQFTAAITCRVHQVLYSVVLCLSCT